MKFDIYFTSEILLLIMAILNMIYSYVASIGTECLQKFSMNISLSSIIFVIFLMVAKRFEEK